MSDALPVSGCLLQRIARKSPLAYAPGMLFALVCGATLSLPSEVPGRFVVHGPEAERPLLEKVRRYADWYWTLEIAVNGWPAPHRLLHIHIQPWRLEGQADVEPEQENPATPRYDRASYMLLASDWQDDAMLESNVAHELAHVSQFALDAAEDDAFYEHAAVFVEARAVNYAPGYGIGIGDFQRHPERSIAHRSEDDYEYGAGLWLMFLSERFDNNEERLVQHLWQRAAQPDALNSVTYLDALPGVLAEVGTSMGPFFAELCAWRYFTGPRDDGAHFLRASEWGSESLAPLSPEPVFDLAPYGCGLSVLSVASHTLEVDTRDAAALVPLDARGRALGTPLIISGSRRLSLPDEARSVLIAATDAPELAPAPSQVYAKRRVSVTVRW